MANKELFGAPTRGTGTSYINHKLVQGSNRYRIGPAYGSLAASGRWFRFIKQHFGYRGTGDDKNPKGYMKVFLCPQEVDRRTKMVIKGCPECDLRDGNESRLEVRERKMQDEGKSKEAIDVVLGAEKAWLKDHNVDKKYIVLAKNEKNEWGVLWLPHKAKEALDNRRKKVQVEQGYDILGIEDGVWVDFVREGTAFNNTTYSCEIVTETVVAENGRKAKVDKQDPLTDADFDAIVATCPDLATVGRFLTDEQIQRLVDSEGDPEVVDAVFNEGRAEASASPKKVQAKPETRKIEKVEKSEPKAAPGPEVDEEAAMLAKLAEIRARKAQTKPVETPSAPEPEAVPEPSEAKTEGQPTLPMEEMSDEEFAKIVASRRKR